MTHFTTMIGMVRWFGTYKGNPAIVLSYYGGASLWHHADGAWTIAKKTTDSPNTIIPSEEEQRIQSHRQG